MKTLKIVAYEKIDTIYHLKYESEELLEFTIYDIIRIIDTANNSFIATIHAIKGNILNFLDASMGELNPWLSPCD